MSSGDQVGNWILQLEKKYGSRRNDEFNRERAPLQRYLTWLARTLNSTYKIDDALSVGGNGVVFRGKHKRFSQDIVLKFNRPSSPEAIETEIGVLPQLRHHNIIGVLDLGDVVLKEDAGPPIPKLTYLVEPYIVGSRPLFTTEKDKLEETWLWQRIDKTSSLLRKATYDAGHTAKYVNTLLADVATVFAQWTSMLSHLHEQGYIYLDIKPDNVLVDKDLHVTAIDFGSVQLLDPEDQQPLLVLYTKHYGHPRLLEKQSQKPSSNRLVSSIKRSDLTTAVDYFALGQSLLQTLNEIARLREHLIPQLPLYRSLHFLATRLLDGENTNENHRDYYPHAPQVFPGLSPDDYRFGGLRYINLADVTRDFDKERGRWDAEDQIPELATFSKDIVRVVPRFNTVLTPRLRSIIEHPLVARLKYVTQLGLVSLLYPTADHSRYDHALGSYTYTTNYVKSLFNDLGNPLFRNLVGADDLAAVLLASLLHDIGQYPLAHDLEEVHDRIFKHTSLGELLLRDPQPDLQGRSLRDLIEDPDNGWGIALDAIAGILVAHSRSGLLGTQHAPATLKTDILSSLLDGPIDVDKADYIIRDSARCELPYGGQLDIERLLRVLTVAVLPSRIAPRRVTLGVYDKGIASAHAFAQARYQLLSTVYWHHTARIIKAMLQYASVLALPPHVFSGVPDPLRDSLELQIREKLLDFIKSLVPPFDVPGGSTTGTIATMLPRLDISAEPPPDVFTAASQAAVATDQTDAAKWYPGVAWTDWLMLRWLSQLATWTSQQGGDGEPLEARTRRDEARQRSHNLLLALRTRRLYKRVATLARGGKYDELVKRLVGTSWVERISLCSKLHELVRSRIKQHIDNPPTATFLEETDFDRLCASNLLILIDIPRPSLKIGYERPLGIVPELKEKSYHQHSKEATEDVKWRETTKQMLESIAPVRVLCHPDILNMLSACYSPPVAPGTNVEDGLANEIRSLLS